MKIDNNYKLRDIAGECIVVNQGTEQVSMTRIISLNESAELLFNNLAGREFTIEDVAALLTDNYEVEAEVALADAAKWVENLAGCGVITR